MGGLWRPDTRQCAPWSPATPPLTDDDDPGTGLEKLGVVSGKRSSSGMELKLLLLVFCTLG